MQRWFLQHHKFHDTTCAALRHTPIWNMQHFKFPRYCMHCATIYTSYFHTTTYYALKYVIWSFPRWVGQIQVHLLIQRYHELCIPCMWYISQHIPQCNVGLAQRGKKIIYFRAAYVVTWKKDNLRGSLVVTLQCWPDQDM